MIFGKGKGEKKMSEEETVDIPVEETEETVEAPAVEEAPEKPKRQEPKVDIEIGTAKAVIEVPLDCDDKPEVDVLVNQMATAKALALSKSRTIIKAVRNSKTKAMEGRPVLDPAAKKIVVKVAFEPPISEDFVKAAEGVV